MKGLVILGICAMLAVPAWAGTATYDGLGGGAVALPGTSGLTDPPEIFNWVSNGDGTYHIESDDGVGGGGGAGRVKGVFSLNDGSTVLQVVDGNAYSVTGTCVIPASGVDANGENYRFFVGSDVDDPPGGGTGQLGVAGIRWSVGNAQWELSSDNDAFMGMSTALAVVTGDVVDVRTTRAPDDLLMEYRINGGAWTAHPWHPALVAHPVPKWVLDAFVADVGDDFPSFSIRGEWGSIGPIVIEGATVPDQTRPVITLTGDAVMNWSLDVPWVDPGYTGTDENLTKLDITGNVDVGGTVDASTVGVYNLTYDVDDTAGNSAIQVTRQVTVMNDTDSDGLDDSWEIDNFGDLDEGPEDDPDNDGKTNAEELADGTDPTDETSRLPVAGLLALALLAAAAGSTAVRRIRK